MALDIAACVDSLVPDARFKGSATIVDQADWESREWVDDRPRPNWAAITAASVGVEKTKADSAALAGKREKYRLQAERAEAVKANDTDTVAVIDAELAKLS